VADCLTGSYIVRQPESAVPPILNAAIRVALGLLGCLWCLGGFFGALWAGSDRAWGPAVGATATMLLGYCLAYWAFVRAPWEAKAGHDERAS
jgi:hypothetical protein